MALARGQVTCLQLNQGGSAFVGIKDDTNLVTGFIISDLPHVWVSLLQAGLIDGKQVEINRDDEDGEILSVRINKSPEPG